jgi:hypothetical protein
MYTITIIQYTIVTILLFTVVKAKSKCVIAKNYQTSNEMKKKIVLHLSLITISSVTFRREKGKDNDRYRCLSIAK